MWASGVTKPPGMYCEVASAYLITLLPALFKHLTLAIYPQAIGRVFCCTNSFKEINKFCIFAIVQPLVLLSLFFMTLPYILQLLSCFPVSSFLYVYFPVPFLSSPSCISWLLPTFLYFFFFPIVFIHRLSFSFVDPYHFTLSLLDVFQYFLSSTSHISYPLPLPPLHCSFSFAVPLLLSASLTLIQLVFLCHHAES